MKIIYLVCAVFCFSMHSYCQITQDESNSIIKIGPKLVLQYGGEKCNNWVRGFISSSINWNLTDDVWEVGYLNQTDFSMMKFANGGSIVFYTRNDIGDNYSISDSDLATYARLIINKYGCVGIGTTSPEYKLDVAGTIRAEEILVEEDVAATNLRLKGNLAAHNITVKTNGNTADFVFDDNYDLKDLSEIEGYIKIHKHLPDIPSAEEMEKSGVNLAEMNKLLLQKVEELTLYLIEKNEKDNDQEVRIKKLVKKNSDLENRLSIIEKTILNK